MSYLNVLVEGIISHQTYNFVIVLQRNLLVPLVGFFSSLISLPSPFKFDRKQRLDVFSGISSLCETFITGTVVLDSYNGPRVHFLW